MTASLQTRPAADPAATVIDRLFGLVSGWAASRPTAAATIARGEAVSWSELAGDTARLAGSLRSRGIGPGSSVALLTGRSRYAVAALLATWSCGATALLIDERHPTERIGHALRDSGTRHLLAEEITPALLGLGTPILPVPNLIAAAAQAEAEAEPAAEAERLTPLARVAADDLAYLIYTSGTTGLPKGVEISFGNLDTFVAALQTLRLPEGGVGVNAVSPAFDGWLWCTLLYLVYGQALGIVDLVTAKEAGLGAAIEALQPTVVCLTPSLLAACDTPLASAEVIVTAGEVCTPELVGRFAGGRRMLNVYGPTEATIAATWADSAAGHDLGTIGVALPGYTAHVLDERRRPVRPGAVGELHIAGPAVGRGYRNLPEATAQRFSDELRLPGGRCYATGDLVRRNADGVLEFVGRADSQVKVRGFRVELEELERQAQLVEGVTQATAFVLPSGQLLGLAIRPSTRHSCPSDAELRSRLAVALPDYLMPAAILRFDGPLPTTATGKVDRDALAAAVGGLPVAEPPADEQPGTPQETLIAGIWAELLDQPVSDLRASFFELGGHSLLAAQLVARIREVTGVSVSMRDLLANPTISALAALIDGATGGTGRKHAL